MIDSVHICGKVLVTDGRTAIYISLSDAETLKQQLTNILQESDWDEKRVDTIGQNGNTGDHYKP